MRPRYFVCSNDALSFPGWGQDRWRLMLN